MSNILSVKNILVLVLMFLLVPGLMFVDNSAKADETFPNISPLISFQEAYPSDWDDNNNNVNWTPAGLFGNGNVPTDGTVLTACLDANHVSSFSGQIAFVVASTGKTYTLNTLNAQQTGFGTPSKPEGSVWNSDYDPPPPKEQCVTKIIVTSNDTTLSFFGTTETIGVDKDACVYYKHQNASDWTGGRCISLDGNPGPMTSAFENSSVAVGAVADPTNSTAEMPPIVNSPEFSYYMLVFVFLITGYAIIHRLPELISEKN